MHYPTLEDGVLGPIIPEVRKLRKIGAVGELSALLVDASVPQSVRYKIAHVAMVAQRSMPEYKTGYDGTITEDDQRLYVLAEGDRVVAFILTALEDRFWRLSWGVSDRFSLLDKGPLMRRGYKVGRIWVASERRRSGLAAQLVSLAVQHLEVVISDVGWELPFSSNGAVFVRQLLPTAFLGCADPYTLYKALQPH